MKKRLKETSSVFFLRRKAVTVICRPSIRMSPALYPCVAFDMAGHMMTDADVAFESVCSAAVKEMSAGGKKAAFRQEPADHLTV